VPSGSGDRDQSGKNGSKRGIMRKLGMGRSRGKEDNKVKQRKIEEKV
jgi:hypothetical protein